MSRILIIGGCNYDMTAFSYNPLIEHDSNIGKLATAPGGVSRNIAVDLRYLKDDVTFLTAIGNDAHGDEIKRELHNLGIKVMNIPSSYPTSSYLAIHDSDGDLKVAICASDIYDKMKKEQILPFIEDLKQYKKIVIDTNLNEEVLGFLFAELPDTEFLVEGVSANKIIRLKPYLNKIHLLKCNIIEAKYLIDSDGDIETILNKLNRVGVTNAVISEGSKPIYISDNGKIDVVNVPPVDGIVNTSGSGDGLFAGILHLLYQDRPLKEAVEFGIKVSQQILKSPISTDPDIAKLVD